MRIGILRCLHVIVAIVLLLCSTQSTTYAQSSASDLRAQLAQQFGEHILLLSETTEAAITGTTASYRAAFAELDKNSLAMSETIGSIYGEEAVDQFLPLWRAQIVALLDYGAAAVANDAGALETAAQEVEKVHAQIAAFFASVNPQVAEADFVALLEPYRLTLTALTEAQASNDLAEAHRLSVEAHRYATNEITQSLATAIDKQFPDEYLGTVQSPAAKLHAQFTTLLGEQVVLVENYTDAILEGSGEAMDDASETLQANTTALAQLFGAAYNEEAATSFSTLWTSFNEATLAYADAVATEDEEAQEAQAEALDEVVTGFGDFLDTLSPDWDSEAAAELVRTHVDELVQKIDAQASEAPADLYPHLFAAYQNASGALATSLSAGITAQFPDKYPSNDPDSLPTTGSISMLSLLLIAAGLGLRVISHALRRRLSENVLVSPTAY